MKFTRKVKRNRRCLGLIGIALAFRELVTSDPLPVRVFSGHIGKHVHIRLNTTDISIYNQIFVRHEYDFPIAVAPKVIIDAGANVGFSAIYFARRFPAAKIYALEPEQSNFDLLVKNVAPFPNVVPVNKALWNETTELEIFDPGPGRAGLQKDGFQTFDANDTRGRSVERVRAIDLDSLMHEFHIDHIDLLKIDIEGAEREVFQRPGAWIDRVGIIAVELHDRLRPGCSRAFYNATNRFEFETSKGENVIVARAGYMMPDSKSIATNASADTRMPTASTPTSH
jgi:FkbM family methyltransferase